LLLLILFVASWRKNHQGCRYGNLKDHQKLCAGTARDYSTTFAAGCKDHNHNMARLSVITVCEQRKEQLALCHKSLERTKAERQRSPLRFQEQPDLF
jgi:hypothetical protein